MHLGELDVCCHIDIYFDVLLYFCSNSAAKLQQNVILYKCFRGYLSYKSSLNINL